MEVGLLNHSELDQRYAFLRDVTSLIPGWLVDYSALMTMELLHWQERSNVKAPLLEIGVYAGKYLSILLRSGAQTGDNVYGLDTFDLVSEESALGYLQQNPIGAMPIFIKAPSTNFTASDLLQRLGAKPRFISIDGSHEFDDVFHDLRLSEELLDSRGIIAVDDFLNPMAFGVMEAVNMFMSTPRSVRPFFYTGNKLYLCRPNRVDTLIAVLEAYMLADSIEPWSEMFRNTLASSRQNVESCAWRHKFIHVP
jgi:hypothetical protein